MTNYAREQREKQINNAKKLVKVDGKEFTTILDALRSLPEEEIKELFADIAKKELQNGMLLLDKIFEENILSEKEWQDEWLPKKLTPDATYQLFAAVLDFKNDQKKDGNDDAFVYVTSKKTPMYKHKDFIIQSLKGLGFKLKICDLQEAMAEIEKNEEKKAREK